MDLLKEWITIQILQFKRNYFSAEKNRWLLSCWRFDIVGIIFNIIYFKSIVEIIWPTGLIFFPQTLEKTKKEVEN